MAPTKYPLATACAGCSIRHKYSERPATVAEGFKSGVLKDTAGLKATAEGFRVRSSGGKLKVTDGPFTEAKEVVGGYALVEVKSKEGALDVARQFMELHRVHWPVFEGECEVRPLEDM